MRRILAMLFTAGAMIIGPASTAGATHTGCEHGRTAQAHASVPHRNEGTHRAHMAIPYCAPDDAPGHGG